MRFNAVAGNPPYQEADGGAGASARPLYPCFVDLSRNLYPDRLCLIIPARWYTGGKRLDDFRESMLSDNHIKELHDCPHPEEFFQTAHIRGGICWFLWEREYGGKATDLVKVVTHKRNGETVEEIRPLKPKDLDIFIRDSAALTILDKVFSDGNTDTLSAHISPRRPFGLEGNLVNSPKFHLSSDGMADPVKCYGRAKAVGYVERADIPAHQEWIDAWKVYMPYANNIGTELSDDNQNTFVGEPNSVCTETFLAVSAGDLLLRRQCENLSAYLRTKFARFLLYLSKTSQHGTAKTYRFVPMLDFSEGWTDEKLYGKYGLDREEIALIERSIKAMR